jgi:outer membrane protein assembly factor BamB
MLGSLKLSALISVVSISATGGSRAEWPQYRGPHRNGTSRETGLVWPEGGPKELWRKPIGPAFSGIAAVEGRLYTTDSDLESDYAVCLDAATGEEIWRTRMGPVYEALYYGNGSLATPTVAGGLVFTLSGHGVLTAHDRASGKTVWKVDYRRSFRAEQPQYGHSASPLVVGDLLIAQPGGPEGKGIVALDKTTGVVKWTVDDEDVGYSSPLDVVFGDSRMIVLLTRTNTLVLSPEGEVLWRQGFGEWFADKVAMPVFVEPDLLFFSASGDVGALVVRMFKVKGRQMTFEPVWRSREMRNHFNSSVPVDRHVYGFDNSALKCIDATTGVTSWVKRGLGKGSLIYADDHLWVLSEAGKLLWVEATPEAFRERASLQVLTGRRNWTEPTLSDGKLFLRNLKEAVALDLKTGRVGASGR